MQPNWSTLFKGGLVAGGFFVLTGVLTGLVPTPIFDRMVPRSPLDFGFLGVTSALAGVYVVQRLARTDCSGDRCAYGGAANGFFAVACPHCNAVLVALFGSSWLATYVDPRRPLLGVLSVGLLAGIVYARSNQN